MKILRYKDNPYLPQLVVVEEDELVDDNAFIPSKPSKIKSKEQLYLGDYLVIDGMQTGEHILNIITNKTLTKNRECYYHFLELGHFSAFYGDEKNGEIDFEFPPIDFENKGLQALLKAKLANDNNTDLSVSRSLLHFPNNVPFLIPSNQTLEYLETEIKFASYVEISAPNIGRSGIIQLLKKLKKTNIEVDLITYFFERISTPLTNTLPELNHLSTIQKNAPNFSFFINPYIKPQQDFDSKQIWLLFDNRLFTFFGSPFFEFPLPILSIFHDRNPSSSITNYQIKPPNLYELNMKNFFFSLPINLTSIHFFNSNPFVKFNTQNSYTLSNLPFNYTQNGLIRSLNQEGGDLHINKKNRFLLDYITHFKGNELFLDGINISTIPNEIFNLSLIKLSIVNCPIEVVSTDIIKMEYLEELIIRNSLIIDLPDEISTLDKLCNLDLRNNQFKEVPEALIHLTNDVEEIQLIGNPIVNEKIKNTIELSEDGIFVGSPFHGYLLSRKHGLIENKEEKGYIIEIESSIRTAVKQYLEYFEDYVIATTDLNEGKLKVERVSNGLKLIIETETDEEKEVINNCLQDYLSFIKTNIDDIELNFQKGTTVLQQEMETLKIKQEVQMLQMKVENANMQKRIDEHHFKQQISLLQTELETSKQLISYQAASIIEKDNTINTTNRKVIELYEAKEKLIEEKHEDSIPSLKQKIEVVERNIRKLIAKVLDDNAQNDAYTELLPSHVQSAIQNEMRKKINDNPSLTASDFPTTYDKLRLLVISKYYPIIKDNWNLFEEIFKQQDRLVKKFDQFGKLRNMIYHDNLYSEITFYDGKAAITYFEGITNVQRV